jgi:hypothetical protein
MSVYTNMNTTAELVQLRALIPDIGVFSRDRKLSWADEVEISEQIGAMDKVEQLHAAEVTISDLTSLLPTFTGSFDDFLNPRSVS